MSVSPCAKVSCLAFTHRSSPAKGGHRPGSLLGFTVSGSERLSQSKDPAHKACCRGSGHVSSPSVSSSSVLTNWPRSLSCLFIISKRDLHVSKSAAATRFPHVAHSHSLPPALSHIGTVNIVTEAATDFKILFKACELICALCLANSLSISATTDLSSEGIDLPIASPQLTLLTLQR